MMVLISTTPIPAVAVTKVSGTIALVEEPTAIVQLSELTDFANMEL